jgi:hypothetical protein
MKSSVIKTMNWEQHDFIPSDSSVDYFLDSGNEKFNSTACTGYIFRRTTNAAFVSSNVLYIFTRVCDLKNFPGCDTPDPLWKGGKGKERGRE